MPLLKLTGFVLRSRPWGEADKLVTFFTREKGRLLGVVRGARKPQGHWGGALEPLTLLDLLFYEKSGRYTLTQCQIVKSFHGLRQILSSGSVPFYLIELIEEFTAEEDSNPQLFSEMQGAFSSLEEGKATLPVINAFRLKMLTLLGFWPRLDNCASCGRKIQGVVLSFNPRSGGLLCRNCKASSQGSFDISRKTVNRALALMNTPWEEIGSQEKEDLELNEVLAAFIGAQLGREASKVKSYTEKLENSQST
jgi:DNA repair protein RecO (recombination protein O)